MTGHWRSARGEDHGLDSQPGDVWVESDPVDVVKHLCGHLRGLLDMMGPCDNFDHHGYCQSHFVESPCRVAKAREFLESLSNIAVRGAAEPRTLHGLVRPSGVSE